MAGIFGSILGLTPKAQKYKKSMRKLQRNEADNRIAEANRQIAFRTTEDPREQAALKQGMFGRGLGKSTIHDQDKARLDTIQSSRNARMKEGHEQATEYRRMLSHKFALERRSQYIQIIDSLLGLAGGGQGGEMGGGMGGGGNGDFGFGASFGGQQGASYGGMF